MIVFLDLIKKTFVVYVIFLNLSLKFLVYSTQKAKIALLFTKKSVIKSKNSFIIYQKKCYSGQILELCKWFFQKNKL